jgi:hypothetical protein
MDNPFFVLTDSDGEIIGVIKNESTSKLDSLTVRIKNAVKTKLGLHVKAVTIPSDYNEHHKPFEATINTSNEQNLSFTLTMAWEF